MQASVVSHQAQADPVRHGQAQSTGRHPNRAIKADNLTVQHSVFHNVAGHSGKFSRIPQSGGKWHLLPERGLNIVWQTSQQGRQKQARGNRTYPYPTSRQIAGHRQCHPDNSTFRGRIGHLSDLPLVRSDRGGIHNHPPLHHPDRQPGPPTSSLRLVTRS